MVVFGDRWSLLVLRDIVFGDPLSPRAACRLGRGDRLVPVFAQRAFAPSCSNTAAPRCGRSSWTSLAASTLAPNPHAGPLAGRRLLLHLP